MSQSDPLEIIERLKTFFKENKVEATVKHQGGDYFRIYGKCPDGVQVYVSVLWSESP